MTSKTSKAKWVAGLAAVVMVGSAQALPLIDRGGGMIYDPDRNLTWLQDWNTNGLMNWTTANNWANNLVHGGFSDWRLPTTLQPDPTCSIQSGGVSYGYNCTGSELGHMFNEHLGGNAFESVINQTNDTAEEIANLALFTNVQSIVYWSGTVCAPNPSFAWDFNTLVGFQASAASSMSCMP